MAKAEKLKELFGTSQPPEQSLWLAAGSLRTALKGGNLGSIAFNGVEILRGIAFLVRDENWGTCPATITSLKLLQKKNSFAVSYKGEVRNGDATLSYRASITASADQLTFHVKATPDNDFKTNRTGFVILHPINGVAGKLLTVTHTDGTIERAYFPKLISPGQPFFDIRALEHAPLPGLKARVLMQGHKFEMEDQRNWTDASYKTYVCSLLDPWPYVLKGGETFEQRVTLTITGTAKTKNRASSNNLHIGKSFRLPELGVAVPQDFAQQSLKSLRQIAALNPKHLTCVLDAATDFKTACASYAELNNQSGIPITLEIILPGEEPADSAMARVASAALQAGLNPKRIVVTQAHDLKSFQPTDQRPWGPSYEEMASAARKYFPGSEIGGGMMSYFTEINRKRPPQGVFDFITHSICPVVHDASDAAVMQTLECLPHVFATAKSFIGKTPYHLGPSSIGARMNPYGAALASNPQGQRVCLAPNDPRQNGTFAQAWNLGVMTAAGHAGLKSITLSSICGPQGLIDDKGKAKPLFDLLTELGKFSGKRVSAIASANPSVFGFVAKTEGGTWAWLANCSNQSTTIEFGGKRYRLSAYQTRVLR